MSKKQKPSPAAAGVDVDLAAELATITLRTWIANFGVLSPDVIKICMTESLKLDRGATKERVAEHVEAIGHKMIDSLTPDMARTAVHYSKQADPEGHGVQALDSATDFLTKLAGKEQQGRAIVIIATPPTTETDDDETTTH